MGEENGWLKQYLQENFGRIDDRFAAIETRLNGMPQRPGPVGTPRSWFYGACTLAGTFGAWVFAVFIEMKQDIFKLIAAIKGAN